MARSNAMTTGMGSQSPTAPVNPAPSGSSSQKLVNRQVPSWLASISRIRE